jgi:hypothetical protein
MLDGTNWQMVWIIPAGIPFLVFYYLHLIWFEKREEIQNLIRY